MDWNSALLAALTGATVAALGQMLTQWHERQQRRREIILRVSLEAARAQLAVDKLYAEQSRREVWLRNELLVAGDYYPLVEALFDRGEHPAENWADARLRASVSETIGRAENQAS